MPAPASVALVLVAMPAAALLGANAVVLAARSGRDARDPADLPPCRIAVIPLTSREVAPGVRNRHFELRLEQAVLTWRAGRAERLVVSGGAKECAEMREELVLAGVPADAVVDDDRGWTTFDALRHAAALADGERIIVVGESWHVPRALLYARALGIDAVGSSRKRPETFVTVVRQSARVGKVPAEVREVAARVKALGDVARLRLG